jgi:hypothetical protein
VNFLTDSALRSLRQEDNKFQASLDYKARPCIKKKVYSRKHPHKMPF